MELIIELAETELDEVYGGQLNFSGASFSIRQNARGGDSIAVGGNGGNARATSGDAIGGAGGDATSDAGGTGGFNSVIFEG